MSEKRSAAAELRLALETRRMCKNLRSIEINLRNIARQANNDAPGLEDLLDADFFAKADPTLDFGDRVDRVHRHYHQLLNALETYRYFGENAWPDVLWKMGYGQSDDPGGEVTQ